MYEISSFFVRLQGVEPLHTAKLQTRQKYKFRLV